MSVALKAGVVGHPVDHSLSPRLHGYWLKQYGIAGSYEAFDIEPQHLHAFLRGMPRQGLRGANLTVPHKEAALGVLDRLDPVAARIGAVNTIVVGADGKLEGRNTDAYGFAQNLLAADVKPGGAAALLGAGGAARAVLAALEDMGYGEIRIVARSIERAAALAESCKSARVFAWSNYRESLNGAALLVNSTPLGMQGQAALDISLDGLPVSAVVTDLVYAPLQTPLLAKAGHAGHKTVDGLGMLLHQARPAFAAFFGRDPEVNDELRRFVLEGK